MTPLFLQFNLNSIRELHSKDNFRQLIVTAEVPPAFLGGLGKFVDPWRAQCC
jgi:hypothetical protein